MDLSGLRFEYFKRTKRTTNDVFQKNEKTRTTNDVFQNNKCYFKRTQQEQQMLLHKNATRTTNDTSKERNKSNKWHFKRTKNKSNNCSLPVSGRHAPSG